MGYSSLLPIFSVFFFLFGVLCMFDITRSSKLSFFFILFQFSVFFFFLAGEVMVQPLSSWHNGVFLWLRDHTLWNVKWGEAMWADGDDCWWKILLDTEMFLFALDWEWPRKEEHLRNQFFYEFLILFPLIPISLSPPNFCHLSPLFLLCLYLVLFFVHL